jgi:uncharacterized membrane protein
MHFKFSQNDKNRILEAIQEAEKQTSGEIRVHADSKCSGDPVQSAIAQFERLKMHETKDRNGVLIYIATRDRKLAIIGDQNINEKVSSDYWENTKNNLIAAFKKGEYVNGITDAVADVGEKLKAYFPYLSDDTNELANDLSIGEGK